MRKRYIALTLFSVLVLAFSSCLKDDDTEVSYYGDAAITAFSLGTLNRTVHTTTSAGKDSTYNTTITGSTYKFHINQLTREIYNVDSLPIGTDVKHVLVTITAKTGGTVVIKNINNDTLVYYNSADSIDFSVPRQISVYANTDANTTVHTDYTVKVNVHQQESDQFNWSLLSETDGFKNTQGMKAYSFNGQICVFLSTANSTQLMCTAENDGATWVRPWENGNNSLGHFAATDYQNTAVANNHLYIFSDGTLYQSADIYNWTIISHPLLTRLIGGSSHELYGIDAQGYLVASYDGGINWQRERIDNDILLLPTQDINVVHAPSLINDDTEAVTIIGNRSPEAYYDDLSAMVWYKVTDNDPSTSTSLWMHIDGSDQPDYQLPRLSNIAVTAYNKGIIALGGKGLGACVQSPFLRFYFSQNNGLYWHKDSKYLLPSGFSSASESFALVTDSQQHLWFICGGSGQVWRGGLNEASWTQYPSAYTE